MVRSDEKIDSRTIRRLLLFTAICVISALPAAGCSDGREGADRPNIVFILADDLGWAELGVDGNDFHETPNLDRLASQGVRFTNAYASAPVCSPTRASLMTGQVPARVGITDYLRPGSDVHLSPDTITIAERLKATGYRTGIVGKWHLTGYETHGAVESPPSEHGFDEAMITDSRNVALGDYFHPYHFNQEIERRMPWPEHLVDRCNLEAVDFIDRHRGEPFFLLLSHYAVHTLVRGRRDLVEKYEDKPCSGQTLFARRNNPHLAALLEAIDEGVGAIVERLDDLGLTESTLVVFTSDNGGESEGLTAVTTNEPLRGAKSMLYEGGIRVPLIVSRPGVVRPGGICDTPVSTVDFFPTFLEMAGLRPDKGVLVDGISITPLLTNPAGALERSTLYWHYPLRVPHIIGGRSSGAVRHGEYKLIEFFDTGELELYDMGIDIGEKDNLIDLFPEKAAALHAALIEWRSSVGAETEP